MVKASMHQVCDWLTTQHKISLIFNHDLVLKSKVSCSHHKHKHRWIVCFLTECMALNRQPMTLNCHALMLITCIFFFTALQSFFRHALLDRDS